ncbi:MAG: tRNA (adenosine(37)-N6)-threonylcarbamoyltransferase complex transferase subunit TsaD [Candidatus Omnitrophica bacterium]|nr:tRNA (adenosine(37)-N6)-threonylcarbamoyltransferase complex transferase subunit TsaD [Candidatus Omnitrophota bacterium]
MIVLGLETSCDETSAAIVRNGCAILSNTVASSLEFHKKYGGVIPEIASRMQLETITGITESALEKAGKKLKEVDLISVTNRPGLIGSLLVGISFAKALSLSLNKPLIGVNHVYSHFYANFLNGEKIRFPFIALVVSGGHTNLFFVRDFDKIDLLGQTQDDACGEAFDKVAKILGLGYPGGPVIERMAKLGDPKKIKFNCSGTKNELNFSFSGIKTAVLYYARDRRLSLKHKQDICASFQEAVIEALIRKAIAACKIKKTPRLVVGGGVVANQRLRKKFHQAAQGLDLKCYFPQTFLCMDNAAMIAGLGYQLFKKGYRSDLNLSLDLNGRRVC